MNQKLYKVTLRGQHKTEYEGRNKYISYVVADNPTDAEFVMVSELKHKNIDFDEDLTLVNIELVATEGKNHESRFRLYLPNVDDKTGGEKRFTYADIEKAYKSLGWFFVPIEGENFQRVVMEDIFSCLILVGQETYTISDLDKCVKEVLERYTDERCIRCAKFITESMKLILK